MRQQEVSSPSGLRLAERFLCAGSSALLLSAAHLYPELWILSTFALVPFLWQANKIGFAGNCCLGLILGSCYIFVVSPHEMMTGLITFMLKVVFFSTVFSLFGIAVYFLKKHFGFNPVFIAAIWLPLEYGLTRYTGLANFFLRSLDDGSILFRLASLLGLLMISFLIVGINAYILVALEQVVEACSGPVTCPQSTEKTLIKPISVLVPRSFHYHYIHCRAPPI